MQQSAIVADYLDAVTHELRFDVDLARRVRSEVEDHLTEAIADDPEGEASEAARRAIARFGEPREIARQYAPSSLLRQVRQVGAVLVVAIAAILVLMTGRGALYDFLQWRLSTDHLGIGAYAPTIDRYTFQVALIVGVLGWFYIASRRVASSLNANYQSQLKRCLVLPLAAAALLMGAVALDAILAGLRLAQLQVSITAMIPLASIAVEAAFAIATGVLLRRTMRSTALAASLVAEANARRARL